MYRNRTQAREQGRKRKQRTMRRLLFFNVTLLILLIGAGGYYLFYYAGASEPNGVVADNAGSPGGSRGDSQEPGQGEHAASAGTASPTPSPSMLPTVTPSPTPTGSPTPSATPSHSATPSVSPSPSPSPNDNESSSGSNQPGWGGSVPKDAPTVHLAFTGDILLASKVAAHMDSKGLDYPFTGAGAFLKQPDITAGNLETPITTGGTPAQDKQFVFKGKPEYLKPLKKAGFDVVTLANNHTLDQGTEGLLDTIRHLDEAGLPYVGAGRNDKEAYEPYIVNRGGIKVAYIGVSRVMPVIEWKAGPNRIGVADAYDSASAEAAIRAARDKADLLVVMVHWGKERADQPVDHQKTLARNFIDAGADLVIGSHPHVLQGFELYKGKWIAYSLGNFIFTSNANSNTSESGVLDAVCSKDGRCGLKFNPMKIVQSRPQSVTGKEREAQLKRLDSISRAASVAADGTVAKR
ncbi:CapA family protein [Paenibacillus pasadenensis]|uniref:CapA family protein n=1 Tax=Paenibacillus pasadenensis TaxID=217090 RepID=UPI002559D2EE|nr:CapA family protein [Paenibacillus pasadenensis]